MGTSGLGKLLVAEGLILEKNLKIIDRTCLGVSYGTAKAVLTIGLLDEEELASLLVERTSYKRLERGFQIPASSRPSEFLPIPLIRNLEVLPFGLYGTRLDVVVVDPLDYSVIHQVEFFSGYQVRLHITTLSHMSELLEKVLGEFEPSLPKLHRFLQDYSLSSSKNFDLSEAELPDDSLQESSMNLLSNEPFSATDSLNEDIENSFKGDADKNNAVEANQDIGLDSSLSDSGDDEEMEVDITIEDEDFSDEVGSLSDLEEDLTESLASAENETLESEPDEKKDSSQEPVKSEDEPVEASEEDSMVSEWEGMLDEGEEDLLDKEKDSPEAVLDSDQKNEEVIDASSSLDEISDEGSEEGSGEDEMLSEWEGMLDEDTSTDNSAQAMQAELTESKEELEESLEPSSQLEVKETSSINSDDEEKLEDNHLSSDSSSKDEKMDIALQVLNESLTKIMLGMEKDIKRSAAYTFSKVLSNGGIYKVSEGNLSPIVFWTGLEISDTEEGLEKHLDEYDFQPQINSSHEIEENLEWHLKDSEKKNGDRKSFAVAGYIDETKKNGLYVLGDLNDEVIGHIGFEEVSKKYLKCLNDKLAS